MFIGREKVILQSIFGATDCFFSLTRRKRVGSWPETSMNNYRNPCSEILITYDCVDVRIYRKIPYNNSLNTLYNMYYTPTGEKKV
jgi:hypothetical protein